MKKLIVLAWLMSHLLMVGIADAFSIPSRTTTSVADTQINQTNFGGTHPGFAVAGAPIGEGQSWAYLGGAGCYWNGYGRTVSVSAHMSQAGGGRDIYISINGLIVNRHSGYTYNDRLDATALVPPNSGFCIGATAPAEVYILR